MIIGGWVLGAEIKATRLGDRYVTVKGLVERNVIADPRSAPLLQRSRRRPLVALFEDRGRQEDRPAISR